MIDFTVSDNKSDEIKAHPRLRRAHVAARESTSKESRFRAALQPRIRRLERW
jgi:hypothetical protein